MILPIKLFEATNGELSQYENPVIDQIAYFLEVSPPNKNGIGITYVNRNHAKQCLANFEIINYLKTLNK